MHTTFNIWTLFMAFIKYICCHFFSEKNVLIDAVGRSFTISKDLYNFHDFPVTIDVVVRERNIVSGTSFMLLLRVYYSHVVFSYQIT